MDTSTIATLVIAAATSAAFLLAWRTWRQQQADRRPVLEVRHRWEQDGSLGLRATIRNRLHHSLVIERARVLDPFGALLTLERTRDSFGAEASYVRAEAAEVRLDWTVAPAGTPPARFSGGHRVAGTSSDETLEIGVAPPDSWPGGWVRVAVRVAHTAGGGPPEWLTWQERVIRPRVDHP